MTTNIISNTPENEKNEWRTPPAVFAWASSLLGGIDFDTACTDKNALAKRMADDAFSYGWGGICWCNPPYDNITPWVEKALSSKSAITALLIPQPNGEDRYFDLCEKSHEIQIVGRLAFLRPDGTPVSGNTRGSSLFIINGYGQGTRTTVRRDWIFERFGGGV